MTANIASPLPGSFVAGAEQRTEAPIAAIRQSWVRYWTYRRTLGELQGLTRRDLEDLGLEHKALKSIAREAVYGI